MTTKYPRTPHLPFSPGGTIDDKRLERSGHLVGEPLIITVKMDGCRICLEHERVWSPNIISLQWDNTLKQLHFQVRHLISEDVQIFGVCSKILPRYLMLFGVRHLDLNYWASWEEVEVWAEELGVPTVPVLVTEKKFSSEENLRCYILKNVRPEWEGVVVRLSEEFSDNHFHMSVAKFVNSFENELKKV